MQARAVITGDIVDSRHIENKADLIEVLQSNFISFEKKFGFVKSFEIYRGDSFQALLANPKDSLRVALLIRLALRKASMWEARIGIGVGAVKYENTSIKMSNGQAFELSGMALEDMGKTDKRCRIQTCTNQLNAQLEVFCELVDAISRRWSKKSAEVIYRQLLYRETQKEIALQLGISQSAVQQRMAAADYDAVYSYIAYFEKIEFCEEG